MVPVVAQKTSAQPARKEYMRRKRLARSEEEVEADNEEKRRQRAVEQLHVTLRLNSAPRSRPEMTSRKAFRAAFS